jgi:uncharacterized C2H2 Zn-finger protein
MVEYPCEKCNKVFAKKYVYEKHINRKFPCKKPAITTESPQPDPKEVKLKEEIIRLYGLLEKKDSIIAQKDEEIKNITTKRSARTGMYLDSRHTDNYFYLIQEREFVVSNAPVMKIGKTEQDNPTIRLNHYPKGSKVYLLMTVRDCLDFERKVRKTFSTAFTQRKDYGTEYFEGDFGSMIKTVLDLYEEEMVMNF